MPPKKKAAAETTAPVSAPPEEDVSMEEVPAADDLEGEDANPAILANDEQRIRIVCQLSSRIHTF
jgi:hypothetical protein